MNKLILVLVFLGGLGAHAQQDSSLCLDSKRLKRLYEAYNFYDEAQEISRAGKNWQCNPESFPYKIFKSLIVMEDLPLMDMRRDAFNINAFGKSATAYLRARVKNIVFLGDQSFCDGTMVAFVLSDVPHTVHLCGNLGKYSLQFIMHVFIHEARHLDGRGYPHDICNHGFGWGTAGCDSSYELRGSHGMGAEFSVRLSRTEGVEKEARAEARGIAVELFLNRFNKVPFGLSSGVYAQTKKQSLLFLSSEAPQKVLEQVPAGILVLREPYPSWFDKNRGQAVSLVTDLDIPQIVPTRGDFALEFKNDWHPQKRNDLRDVVYSPYLCMIVGIKLQCESGDQIVQMEGLPARPVAFFTADGRVSVSLENNELYHLPLDFRELKGKKLTDFEKVILPQKFTSLVMEPNKKYAVDEQGVLRVFQGKGFQNSQEILPGVLFEKIVGPVLWSPQLRDL